MSRFSVLTTGSQAQKDIKERRIKGQTHGEVETMAFSTHTNSTDQNKTLVYAMEH